MVKEYGAWRSWLADGMRATLSIASASILSISAAVAETTLTTPCNGSELRGRCPATITLTGSISVADASKLRQLLAGEESRTRTKIAPTLIISSTGGDVEAAMQIGRDLRRSEGSALVPQGRPCYSACVLVVAGAVMRLATRLGVHRPYFSDSGTQSLGDADARYKRLMTGVRDYLREMNMADELFQMMQSVAPGEMKMLETNDALRLGFMGDDPAFEETQIAIKARLYGISSAEYRKRRARLGSACGKPESAPSIAEANTRRACQGQLAGALMWSTDAPTAQRIDVGIRQRCGALSATPKWYACARMVAQSIKSGSPLPPDGFCWLDDPDCK